MKKISHIFLLLLVFNMSKIHAQCSVGVNNGGFEYNVEVDLEVTDVVYTQNGSTCNVNLEVTHDVKIDIVNAPDWWDQELYVLQANFNCAGGSGASFFDLPNGGGVGTVLSATFSYGNTICAEAMLDCPITLSLQGPGGLNESSNCGAYIGASLPITLRDFSYAETDEKTINLAWETESEINFSHFELELSNDFKSWESIGRTEGENYSNGAEYSYQLALTSTNRFVRLKMIDLDGSFEYSDILSLPKSSTSEINIFPNPTSEKLFVSGINSDHIMVVNSLGQQSLLTMSADQSIDVSHLQSGQYMIRGIEDRTTETYRFIKL